MKTLLNNLVYNHGIRVLILAIIVLPTILLGWTWFPEADDSVLVAIGVTFAPFIPAWYFSNRIQGWYTESVNYKGVMVFHLIASQVVPEFSQLVATASIKITPEYIQRYLTDPQFMAAENAKCAPKEG